jgi:hypothetical protein
VHSRALAQPSPASSDTESLAPAAYASEVDLARLNQGRARFADSKTAAAAFFVVVLACQVVARAWISSSAVAFAGAFVYSGAALLTWPFLDAAFTRYAAEPTVSAPANRRMPWVWCVLVGVLVSIIIGGLGS